MNDLDVASLRLEVVADFDANIACEELDELKRAISVSEVRISNVREKLISPMIFPSQ